MHDVLPRLRCLPRPGLATRPPTGRTQEGWPRAYVELLAVTDGLVHPKGGPVVCGSDPQEHAAVASRWRDLQAEADEARAEEDLPPWRTEGLRPIGITDRGGLWLLDLSDPETPDPRVLRAEIASLELREVQPSLSRFVAWLLDVAEGRPT